MSGSTKAGEPSMEEILASIRKIIADDPSKAPANNPVAGPPAGATSAAASAPGAKPTSLPSLSVPTPVAPESSGGLGAAVPGAMPSLGAVEASGTSEAPGGRGNPAFGRLSEALRATFATAEDKPTPSFGSLSPGSRLDDVPPVPLTPGRNGSDKPPMAVFRAEERSRSIESELDDILNEPLAGGRLDEADQGKSAPGAPGGQWAVWRTSPGKADDSGNNVKDAGKDKLGDVAASSPGLPPPPPSLGRPSGGFYPASGGFKPSPEPSPRIEPSLQPLGPLPPQSAAPNSLADAGAAARASSTNLGKAPPSAPQTIARFDPKVEGTPSVAESKPAPERGGGKPAPVVIAAMPPSAPPPSAPRPPAAGEPPVAASPAPPSPATVPQPAFSPPPPAAPMSSAQPPTAGTNPAAPGSISVPLPPRANLFSRPFGAKPDPAVLAPTAAPSVRVPPANQPVDRPLPTSSAAAPQRVLGRQSAPASALDALAAGLAASNATASAAPSPASAATSQSGPNAPRSLEDSVADMIKPMLQKWIDDNMPRIIEKALRNETGGKPPQS